MAWAGGPQVKRAPISSIFGLLPPTYYGDVFLEALVVTGHPGNVQRSRLFSGREIDGVSYMYAFFHSGT